MSSPFIFDPTNLLVLPDKILHNFTRADWRQARRHGVAGVLRELVAAGTGFSMHPFFVADNAAWPQPRVRALLRRYGIQSHAYGYWPGEMHFDVARRQAHWAQYVMLRAGVPLLHGLLPGSRALPPAARAQLAGGKARSRDLADRFDL